MKQYDVFISHATKDKNSYVDKLVEAIKKEGLSVFYDTECILWGDSIPEKIAEGLTNCTLAVVVISKNYFGRPWTEYEIRTLLNRQNQDNNKLVMPILYGVSKKQLMMHYPELGNILFKYSKSCSCEEMARALREEINRRKTTNDSA